MRDKRGERRGLGRGLSALMADVAPVEHREGSQRPGPVSEAIIPVESIRANAEQPRKSFSESDLAELANSIREKGVIQPLILRPHPGGADTYEIVAGERRWRAAQLAKLHEVPALIRDYDDIEMLEVAIIENIQRAELNSIEEAAGYRQLMDKFGHTQEKIAEALGKSRSHIANLLRLLNLPDSVQSMVRNGKLSAGHARALVTALDPEALAKSIVGKGLSVREAESLVRKEGKGRRPRGVSKKPEKDADTKALEGDLSAATKMTVRIDHEPGGNAGKIIITYQSLEDLDLLCNALAGMR